MRSMDTMQAVLKNVVPEDNLFAHPLWLPDEDRLKIHLTTTIYGNSETSFSGYELGTFSVAQIANKLEYMLAEAAENIQGEYERLGISIDKYRKEL